MSKPDHRTYRKPVPDKTRSLVYEVLTKVIHEDGYSNLLLPAALKESSLDARDKAFATELLYGTLRMQGQYDYIASQVSDRPWSTVDSGIVDVVNLGAHQLFSMRIPTHAAVSATVELARKYLGESKGSFVNALMRRMSAKTLEEWLEPAQKISDPITRLSITTSHPEWIVSAYLDLLKDIDLVEEALLANNVPATPTLVSWPGKSTQADLIQTGAMPTKYSPYGAVTATPPAELELIKARRAGVQDEGSQLVAHIFSQVASKAQTTLDMCAGPGGKAALLNAIISEDGRTFVANEISGSRASLVSRVVGRSEVLNLDGRNIPALGRTFDAVIADVPCTGLGALRRRPEVRWRRKLSDLANLRPLQLELAQAAINVLNPGGYFGYATCSPHFAETTLVVRELMRKNPTLQIVDLSAFIPEGMSGATLDGALRLWTHEHNTDAMYMAVLHKPFESQ